MGITEQLAKDIYSIQTLSKQDIEQLHMLITDFHAAAIAGHALNRDFNNSIEKVLFSQGGVEESTVLFQKRKYPVHVAALMNAVYGHGAELDDGNKKAAGHVGSHIIPSVFALAEKIGSSNESVLIALAVGYETFIRISSATQPGLIERGFHSTGVVGAIACAAACAKLYRLDARGIEDAMALATTMSCGLLSYGESRPAIKPINPGKAAENGVFAAMLASEGVRGPAEALEGKNGWFHAVTDNVEEQYLRGSDRLLLHECYIKLYPSCRHTHCGIDAAINMHQKVCSKDIDSIKVFIYPNAIKLAGIKYPKNQNETKFSIYYTLASALRNGSYGIKDMNPAKNTEEIVSLIDKIQLIPDLRMEERAKGIRGARVEIITKEGDSIEEIVWTPKGDPENPISMIDVKGKLKDCVMNQMSDEKIQELANAVIDIKGSTCFRNPIGIASLTQA